MDLNLIESRNPGIVFDKDTVYIVGHRNPDTDSVMAAIGYAWFLGEKDKVKARAVRAGKINLQSAFALEKFGLETPPLLLDASTRFAMICLQVKPLGPESTLGDAWTLISKTRRGCPIVDSSGQPLGLVTGWSVFDRLTRLLGVDGSGDGEDSPSPNPLFSKNNSFHETTFNSLSSVLSLPAIDALNKDTPSFEWDERIADIIGRVLKLPQNDFIVTKNGLYYGVFTKTDLLNPPRMKLILIDHNEAAQAIRGIDEAELLEVLDHHRLANAPTHIPIVFHAEPVGSSSTLVSEKIMKSGLTPPRAIAGALLSGILSDTLLLRSPTSTDRDMVAAVQVASWAFPGERNPYRAMEEYGNELLKAGASIRERDVKDIVMSDFKEYDEGGTKFGISQVEVADLHEIEFKTEEIKNYLKLFCEMKGLSFMALMVTDVVKGNSVLLYYDERRCIDGLPYSRLPNGALSMPGVVSRKKQLLPAILSALKS
ncbi:MAG: DHH family phosphoesterase [Thermoplasmata archaeon]